MSFPTIRERVHQIKTFGIPYVVQGGNQLTSVHSEDVVGFLDACIPELILPMGSIRNPFYNLKINLDFETMIGKEYTKALSNASDGQIPAEKFVVEHRSRVCAAAIEIHAFYDPKQDMSHFFALPSRKLMKKYNR